MRRAILALTVLGLPWAGGAAQERTAIWSGWAEDGYGGAADCTDCFENEYVLLGCARGAPEVRAELLGLLPPEDVGERITVTLEVDGEADEREAAIEPSEMYGAVSVLVLRVGDPLFDRLGQGERLVLSMPGPNRAAARRGRRGAGGDVRRLPLGEGWATGHPAVAPPQDVQAWIAPRPQASAASRIASE